MINLSTVFSPLDKPIWVDLSQILHSYIYFYIEYVVAVRVDTVQIPNTCITFLVKYGVKCAIKNNLQFQLMKFGIAKPSVVQFKFKNTFESKQIK